MTTAPAGTPTLDLPHLKKLVQAGQVDTVLAVFPDLYGRLLGKRFDAGFYVDSVAESGTHACNYLLTVDMEMNPVPGYQYANWNSGYGDFHLVPDQATMRVASWLDKTALVICDIQAETSHDDIRQAPRGLLRQQIRRLASQGLTAMAGSEVEYYIFQDSYREAAKKLHTGMDPAGWYIEDYHTLQGTRVEDINAAARRHLSKSGIEVECTKGEWGLGQHELNLKYCDVLEMSDRHSIYKQCLKEIADSLGMSVTFMAKYAADGAGSSCHIHISLWRDGKNIFAGDRAWGPVHCSDQFRWFLGGWLTHAAELMPFYAPTVNSYKRYQSGSWAPTRIACSHDNRTAGFRVVGRGNSLRIECRVPGADCNPYLAYAAALASGLHGIEEQIEPPPLFEGNMYEAETVPRVPATLAAATELLARSKFARQAFGDDAVEHYLHFFRSEQHAYDQAVTDWERQRYFERI
jgi:glutamine synthetase